MYELDLQLAVRTDVGIPDQEYLWNQKSDVTIDLDHIVSRHCYGTMPRNDEDLK